MSYEEAWIHFQRNLLAVLIRGLHEHWSRSQRGSDVAKLIEAFILAQVVHSSWIEWRYRVFDNRPPSSILFSTSPSHLMDLGIAPPGPVPRLLLQFHGHSKVQLTFLTRLLTWMLCHRRVCISMSHCRWLTRTVQWWKKVSLCTSLGARRSELDTVTVTR